MTINFTNKKAPCVLNGRTVRHRQRSAGSTTIMCSLKTLALATRRWSAVTAALKPPAEYSNTSWACAKFLQRGRRSQHTWEKHRPFFRAPKTMQPTISPALAVSQHAAAMRVITIFPAKHQAKLEARSVHESPRIVIVAIRFAHLHAKLHVGVYLHVLNIYMIVHLHTCTFNMYLTPTCTSTCTIQPHDWTSTCTLNLHVYLHDCASTCTSN